MVGSEIGSFHIVSKLGQGGMGVVYLGEHRRIARKAAIKVLRPQLSNDPVIVERFFNEARATSRLRHPGLVEVSDCNVLPDGSAYIVMELLEGESLGQHLASVGRMPVLRAVLAARNIADALAAAHAQSIVHRDLKPDNVFLLPPPDSSSVPIKVLDFGIAKLMDGGDARHKTRTGILLGTPVYMSPEQCLGAGTVDHRTDIYALGCLMYEMLCGHPPFTSEGFGELLQAHLSVTPQPLRAINPALSPELEDLVAWMLEKSPTDRPQTMRQLVEELDAIATALGAQTPAPRKVSGAAPQLGSTVATMRSERPARKPLKVETTLGSSTWERVPVAKPHSGNGLWAVVIALALVGGGAGIWTVTRPHPRPPEPTTAAPPPAPPPVVKAPPPVAPQPAQPAPKETPSVSPTPPSVAPAVSPPRPAAAPSPSRDRKVKVIITSDPSDADVCLARDRLLIGRTKLSWSADRGAQPTELLIRKRGYRGQEISVIPDRELKTTVRLDKLGPDDIEDIDGCQQ